MGLLAIPARLEFGVVGTLRRHNVNLRFEAGLVIPEPSTIERSPSRGV